MLNFPAAIVSGHATINLAVEAMRQGAVDVLTKPVNSKDLLKFVTKLVQDDVGEVRSDRALRAIDLGRSQVMVNLKGELLKAMTGTAPILFIGPSSAGSEFFARLMHNPGKPWAEYVDLRFLVSAPTGRLAEAHNGTIYLRSLQGLNSIQQRGLFQLVRNAPANDVRIIAESPLNVDELVAEGSLSKELAETFSKYQIKLPELDDFVDKLEPVLTALARTIENEQHPGTTATFSAEAVQMLAADGYRWINGGLASLIGIFRALMRMAPGDEINTEHVRNLLHIENNDTPNIFSGLNVYDMPLRQARELFEKMYFRKLMERSENNFKEAARLSGLERTYIYRKVKSLLPDQEAIARG